MEASKHFLDLVKSVSGSVLGVQHTVLCPIWTGAISRAKFLSKILSCSKATNLFLTEPQCGLLAGRREHFRAFKH